MVVTLPRFFSERKSSCVSKLPFTCKKRRKTFKTYFTIQLCWFCLMKFWGRCWSNVIFKVVWRTLMKRRWYILNVQTLNWAIQIKEKIDITKERKKIDYVYVCLFVWVCVCVWQRERERKRERERQPKNCGFVSLRILRLSLLQAKIHYIVDLSKWEGRREEGSCNFIRNKRSYVAKWEKEGKSYRNI